jgi:site-specific recombinase XerD
VGRSFTPGELHALLRVCVDDPRPGGVRDAAILAILYNAGLRRDELAALEVVDWVPDAVAAQGAAWQGQQAAPGVLV